MTCLMGGVLMFRNILLMLFVFIVFGCTKPEPVGQKKSVGGKTLYLVMMSEPETLHPLKMTGSYGSQIRGYVTDSLARTDLSTYENVPALAKKWEMSEDGLMYTVHLREGVEYTNGEKFDASYVKRNFDMRMDDAYGSFAIRPYIENVDKIEVVEPYIVKIFFKKKYFGNFDAFASLAQIPVKMYKDPKKKLNKTMIGSGPFMIDKYDKGRSITLKKNLNWWGWKEEHPYYKNIYQFDKIHFKFIKDEVKRLEMVKKEKIDFTMLTSEQYVKKTEGKPWGENLSLIHI